ncbi:MAG: sigma-70 family RNA polymerase sigma factor [Isosphaerales bacterium]
MAMGKDRAVFRQLRTLFNVGTIAELTDGQLLERFATSRGEAAELAFAVLVERHGPMVLRVCRSVLVDPDDQEDAFQASFLVLVKKARGLWVRDSLGPWLHQVAFRTASCARSAATRRRRHERLAAMSRPESRHEVVDELGRVLHEEIDRLPERYRAPLVLCDLEGRSHEQAARHLGWPIGTVKSRQARGRERLRDRLRRHGLAPNAGLLATALLPDGDNALLPPALVDSTTRAVVQFATLPTIVRRSAASLVQEVLRSMLMTRWLKVASVLLALGATVSGAGLLAQNGKAGDPPQSQGNPQAARADDTAVHVVKSDKLKVAVIGRGTVEPARTENAFCPVEGQTTIIAIKPDGAMVKKGQVVCELDPAKLKDQLVNQVIAKNRAAADYQTAKLAREAAEIAVNEHIEGIYKHQQDTLSGEIAAARSAIENAEGRLARTRRVRQGLQNIMNASKAARSSADIVAELDIEDRIEATELALKRERMALELSKTKRDVLETYTRGLTTKGLDVDVARKRLDELTQQAILKTEEGKEARLNSRIAACALVAAIDGRLVYANDPNWPIGHSMIEEGATVRERQLIFRIYDPNGPMQVNTKVPESMVDQLKRGLRATIGVDAFPAETLAGLVSDVAPLPDPTSIFKRDSEKVYTTKVKLERGPAGLRPGMSAEVEILVTELDNVLTVPIQAVLHFDGKYQVAVKKPDGRFDWREVTLGVSNDKLIEIKKGIQSGEHVALDPRSLLTEKEREKIGVEAKPANRSIVPRKAAGKAKRLTSPAQTNDHHSNSPNP